MSQLFTSGGQSSGVSALFFFNILFYFLTLQYCIGFAIYQHVSILPQILKEINPEYSLAGLMLRLRLQYFGYLMQRANSLEKTLMLGKVEGRRRRG